MFNFFSSSKPVLVEKEKPKTWGDHTFDFSLRTHGESMYQTSVLYAEATCGNGLPIPIVCKWFRVKGNRTYQIEEISSNIYQLNAEDIGCMIKVEATTINAEEGEGLAFGQFGPVLLDPSARQILEQVLGTGGSQFPVTITYSNKQRNEEEMHDAKLFVSQHLIKICFEDQGASVGSSFAEDVISLKYTIDFPRVEMHPFDTTRFFIFYDKSETVDAHYDFNKKIDLKALSRQSRDLIALCLKCFSAQTYLMNSKIISSLPEIPPQQLSVPDLLLELEQVKKELGNQIQIAKGYFNDRQMLRRQLQSLEEEMHSTIQSYREVLEQSNNGELQGKSSAEITVQVLTKEKSELQSQQILLNDQIESLQVQLQDASQKLSNQVQENQLISCQVGIPVSQHEILKERLEVSTKELAAVKLAHQRQVQEVQKEWEHKTKTLEAETIEVKKRLFERDEEVLKLKETKQITVLDQSKELQSLKAKLLDLTFHLDEADQQNSQLLLQRKNLSKAKDSVQQELIQTLTKLDSVQQAHAECAKLSQEYQLKLDETIRKQAEHHNSEVELHRMDMQKIVKQNNRLSEEISRLQEDQLAQTFDFEQRISKLQNELQQKQQELQLVGQQLRMQLAKKSINKLSEVIGIKSVLTAMNLETDSEEEESAPGTIQKQSQTDPIHKNEAESQTQQEEAKIELVECVMTPRKKQNLKSDPQKNSVKTDPGNDMLNQEIKKLTQLLQVTQTEHKTSIEQLRQQLSKKDAQIITLSNEMQTLAMRLCAAQEQLADM